MGFHAFGDFTMTRRQYENLLPHERTEMALLVKERMREAGDERLLDPAMQRCAGQRHDFRLWWGDVASFSGAPPAGRLPGGRDA